MFAGFFIVEEKDGMMKRWILKLLAATLGLGAAFAQAHEGHAHGLTSAAPHAPAAPAQALLQVQEAWVRSTVPGQKVAAAYMQLKAQEAGWAVVGASSPAAARLELHDMRMDKDVMRMFAIDSLPLPLGQTVALQPAGKHIMLMGLHAPLAEGDSVRLELQLRHSTGKTQTVAWVLPVRAMLPASPYQAGQHPHGH